MRIRLLPCCLFLLALVPAFAAAPAPVSQADIEACAPDAMRLCRAEIERKDYQGAGDCMFKHRAQLSPGCAAVFDKVVVARAQAKGKKKRPALVVPAPVVIPVPVPKPPDLARPAPVVEPAPEPASAPPPAAPPVVEPAPIVPAPAPPAVPVVEHPEEEPPMQTAIPWIQANLVAVLLIMIIVFYVVKNGGPSVLRWFRKMASYAKDEAMVAEGKIAKALPVIHAEFAAIKARHDAEFAAVKSRLDALEGKKPAPPPAQPQA